LDLRHGDLLFGFVRYGGDMNRLDLIIENIEYAKILREGAHQDELLEEALQAARELQALEPVAWAAKSIYGGLEGVSFDKQLRFDTPLYSLEVTK
jgi:hypothetical protein